MSRGLFHKAILHSGTLNNGWSDPQRAGVHRQQALGLAEHVNCTRDDRTTEEIVACLRGVPVEHILSFGSQASPVVEHVQAEEDAFIGSRNFDAHILNSIDIPMLLGINSEEGLLMTGGTKICSSYEFHYDCHNNFYVLHPKSIPKQ